MAARQERIDAFIHEGSPPAGRYVRHSVFMPMDRGHLAKRENTPTYRSCGDRLAGTKTKSALNLEVLSLDWQTICEAGTGECHYQVRLEGKWWHVPPTAVVQSGNRVGPALVWPVYYRDHDILIRCFLPGAGF